MRPGWPHPMIVRGRCATPTSTDREPALPPKSKRATLCGGYGQDVATLGNCRLRVRASHGDKAALAQTYWRPIYFTDASDSADRAGRITWASELRVLRPGHGDLCDPLWRIPTGLGRAPTCFPLPRVS